MKNINISFSIIITLPFLSCFGREKSSDTLKQKPNILIVITDDQGKNDLTCEGNPYVKTPNIDKFCGEALRFSNFHVSTTSAPSRGSIMTGRHTNRLNCFHTIAGLLY